MAIFDAADVSYEITRGSTAGIGAGVDAGVGFGGVDLNQGVGMGRPGDGLE